MELNRDTYYTMEANREYMSCSLFQDFMECEAAAVAKLEGRYRPSSSEALIVGNYFHTAMESPEAHEEFCREHFDDIYKYTIDKKSGDVIVKGKYAPYEHADRMIEVCRRDPLMKHYIDMPGENEAIMTGELFGMKWKIRLDKYIEGKRLIIDYKTVANIYEPRYNAATGKRESFVEAMGYMMRAAVYTEIEKQFKDSDKDANFVILAVSKQDPPDKAAMLLNHRQRYDFELEQIEKRMPRIISVLTKRVKPKRCGACEYCRGTKMLKKLIPYYTLNPDFRDEREEEYDEIFFEGDGNGSVRDMEEAQAQG